MSETIEPQAGRSRSRGLGFSGRETTEQTTEEKTLTLVQCLLILSLKADGSVPLDKLFASDTPLRIALRAAILIELILSRKLQIQTTVIKEENSEKKLQFVKVADTTPCEDTLLEAVRQVIQDAGENFTLGQWVHELYNGKYKIKGLRKVLLKSMKKQGILVATSGAGTAKETYTLADAAIRARLVSKLRYIVLTDSKALKVVDDLPSQSEVLLKKQKEVLGQLQKKVNETAAASTTTTTARPSPAPAASSSPKATTIAVREKLSTASSIKATEFPRINALIPLLHMSKYHIFERYFYPEEKQVADTKAACMMKGFSISKSLYEDEKEGETLSEVVNAVTNVTFLSTLSVAESWNLNYYLYSLLGG